MTINITDLFASVVPDLATQDMAQGRFLAQNLTTPGAGFAMGMPAINRQMQQGVGRIFGNTAQGMGMSPAAVQAAKMAPLGEQDRLKSLLSGADTSTPQGRAATIKALQDQGFGTQALQLRAAFQEQDRQQQETDARTMTGQASLANAALRGTELGAEGAERDIVQAVTPEGNIETIFTDKQGNFYDLQNNPMEIPEGYKVLESATLSGARGDLGLTDTAKENLTQTEVSTKQFIATANDAMDMLDASPDVNTFVGKASNIVNGLKQEAAAIGRSLGMENETLEKLTDESRYDSQFAELGIESQRLRGMVTALAFQAAAASGQSGRDVSNRDIERFIQEIGANASDPDSFKASLRDVMSRTARNFKINYATRLGEEFKGDLGLREGPVINRDGSLNGRVEPPASIVTPTPDSIRGTSTSDLLDML